MIYRKLDADGDYTLGSGSDFYVNVPAAVGQAVQTRLLLLLGEYFANTTLGTPWLTDVIGKYTSKIYDAVIKARILATPGVTKIVNYSSVVIDRALSILVTIDTVYSQDGQSQFTLSVNEANVPITGGFGTGGFGINPGGFGL